MLSDRRSLFVVRRQQVKRLFVLFDLRESSGRLVEMVIDVVVVDL